MEEWHELSRDPRDLNTFLQKLGTEGVEVEEIYNLDSLEDSKHIHGIILLYSWNPVPIPESLFTSPDICAITLIDPKLSLSYSLLTILFNSEVRISPDLQKFKETILPLPPKLRSVAVQNSHNIRIIQNSLARNSAKPMFFTTFFQKTGKIIEIDGLASGPFLLSEVAEDDWLERTKHILNERILRFNEHEVEFSIFAVVSNKAEETERAIKAADKKIAAVKKKLGVKFNEYDQEYFDGLPDDKETLDGELSNLEENKTGLEGILKAEKGKYASWKEENDRRKHNFVPFITSFLEKLDEKNQLMALFEKAIKKKMANS